MILRSHMEAELLTKFADGLDVGGAGTEGNQDGSSRHSLGNWGEVVPFTEMGKNGGWDRLPGREGTSSATDCMTGHS